MSLILSNFGWNAVQQFGLKGSTTILYFLLAKILGPEYLGIMAYALAILAVAELFIVRGISETIIQANVISEKQVNALFLKVLRWALCGFFGLQILSLTMHFLDTNNQVPIVVSSVAFLLFLRPFVAIQNALARRNFKFKEIARATFLASIIADLFAIILAVNGLNIWALIISLYLKFFLLNVFFLKITKIRIHLINISANIEDLISYSNEVFKTKFLSYVVIRADELIIGSFVGMSELGIYSLIIKIFRIIEESFIIPFYNVMFAVFSKAKKISEEIEKVLYSATNILTWATIPIFLAVGFCGENLMSIALGSSWEVGKDLYIFLALYMSFRCFNFLFSAYMISLGFANLVSLSTAIYLMLTIFFLVPLASFGISGVGLGMFLRTAFGLFFSFYFIKKTNFFSLEKYFKNLSAILISMPIVVVLFLISLLTSALFGQFLILPLHYLLLILLGYRKIVYDFKLIRNWHYES